MHMSDGTSEDTSAVEENLLLRALPADQYAEILPHLEPVELSARQVLWQADATIHSLYFPRTCVVSLLTPLADEQPVEAATIGCEGLAGAAGGGGGGGAENKDDGP